MHFKYGMYVFFLMLSEYETYPEVGEIHVSVRHGVYVTTDGVLTI